MPLTARAPSLPPLPLAVFGFVGGFVDVCGYVALGGLFTAHVTGNLAVLGAGIVHASPRIEARMLAAPFFMVAVVIARLLGELIERRGRRSLRLLLGLEIVLLGGFMAGAVLLPQSERPDAAVPLLVTAAATGAMGVQNAAMRLAARSSPQTTGMTGNLTIFVVDMIDVLLPPPEVPSAETRAAARRSGSALLGFVLGAAAGGFGFLEVGVYAVGLPIALLLALAVMRPSPPETPPSAGN